eukprot:3965432-Prymnesium_polylepis.2
MAEWCVQCGPRLVCRHAPVGPGSRRATRYPVSPRNMVVVQLPRVPPSAWLAFLLCYAVLSINVFHTWAWPIHLRSVGSRRTGSAVALQPGAQPRAPSLLQPDPPRSPPPPAAPLPSPLSKPPPPPPLPPPPSPPSREAAYAAGLPPTGFCVRAGYTPGGVRGTAGELLTTNLNLARARAYCARERECAGFMLRTDAAFGGVDDAVMLTFFRHEPGMDPWSVPLNCDAGWVTFVRSPDCAAADGAARAAGAAIAANITLVTQLTSDRQWMLAELAGRWPGPVVAAVMRFDGEGAPRPLPSGVRERVRIVSFRGQRDAHYPINALRNAAIREVSTPRFMLTDVDLWPSANLAAELGALDPAFLATPRLALVIAAFQPDPRALGLLQRPAGGGVSQDLPDDPASLRACFSQRACSAFKGSPDFADGLQLVPGQHLTTDYVRWWASERRLLPYRVPCFDKTSYEPYMVLPAGGEAAGGAPLLDERFVGYGKNKVQWVQGIRGAGFEFYVLPRGFLLHHPHAMSRSGRKWQRNANNHKEVRAGTIPALDERSARA